MKQVLVISSERTGLVIASGLKTGEASIGIPLTILVIIYKSGDIIPYGSIVHVLLQLQVGFFLNETARRDYKN